MSSPRQELLRLLALRSFRLGQFRLSSGGTSDYYVDCRATTLDARGALLTGRVFLDAIRTPPGGGEVDGEVGGEAGGGAGGEKPGATITAVGGLTLGADPIVVAVAVLSAQAPPPMAGFLVRKAEKAHGTGQRIEGPVRAGERAAIVDDVCTTAASTVAAIEAAWAAGLEVARVLCLVEREEAAGRARLEALWRERGGGPCPFQSIFTAAEVRREHVRLLAAGELGGAEALAAGAGA